MDLLYITPIQAMMSMPAKIKSPHHHGIGALLDNTYALNGADIIFNCTQTKQIINMSNAINPMLAFLFQWLPFAL